uniref:F-box domain-containing protein n=1 Tax=Culex tarsalis TaxID=7177 RepID=A0A1Q3EVK4_CULTA
MSERSINDFPVEVLSKVFDLLDFDERKTAKQVCRNWYGILSQERYLRRSILRLVRCLAQDGGSLDKIHHFPVVKIGEVKNNDAVLAKIREFLFSEKVSDSLVEIHLEKFNHPLGSIFDDPAGETTCNLPKLEKIKFAECVKFGSNPVINAPRLKSVQLGCRRGNYYEGDMVIPFVERIQEMDLNASNAVCGRFLSSANNLRRLTMMNQGAMSPQNLQTLKKAFCSVEELNLRCFCKTTIQNLPHLLQDANNLRTLSIATFNFDLNVLAPLENLLELNLHSITLESETFNSKVILPQLKKLQTIAIVTKWIEAPNLKSLTLHEGSHDCRLGDDQTKQFFARCSNNLQVLHLKDLELRKSCVEAITVLKNLEILSMVDVMIDTKDVTRIFQQLSRLRWTRFENVYSKKHGCEQADLLRKFYDGIRQRYVNCAVIVQFDD